MGGRIRPDRQPAGSPASARAAMLRRGALAELEASSDPDARPPAGPPGASANEAMTERTDGEGWDDRTQGDLTDGSGEKDEVESNVVPVPKGARSSSPEDSLPSNDFTTEQTQEVVSSVSNISEFETMDGLEAVRPSTPLFLVALGALIPLFGALVVGGVAVSQDWGGVRSLMVSVLEGGETKAKDEAAAAAEAVLVEDLVDEVEQPRNTAEDAQGVEVVRFVSKWPDTIKLRVRCKEETAKGVAEVTLERAAASRCSVTAIRGDRCRLTGVVDVATEGKWVCFEKGEEGCRQE